MRKFALTIMSLAALVALIGALSGCFSQSTSLQNDCELGLEGVAHVDISYATENITIYKSDTDSLFVKEYMSSDNPSYHADVSTVGPTLKIAAGSRPDTMEGFKSYIEIYLPESFEGDVRIFSARGTVRNTSASTFSDLAITTQTGAISVTDVEADSLTLTSGSGRIAVDKCNGVLSASTSTGNVAITSFRGSASVSTTSGKIEADFAAVNGDIDITTTSGKIALGIPSGIGFSFEAWTDRGKLTVPFTDQLTEEEWDSRTSIVSRDTDVSTHYSANIGAFQPTSIRFETTTGPMELSYS